MNVPFFPVSIISLAAVCLLIRLLIGAPDGIAIELVVVLLLTSWHAGFLVLVVAWCCLPFVPESRLRSAAHL